MLGKSVVLLCASLLFLSACAAPVADSAAPPAPGADNATPAAAAPVATSPAPAAAAPAAALPTAALSAAATPASAAAAPAAAVSASAYHLALVQDGTQARFRVREQLAGRNLPSDAVGTTQAVTGGMVITPDGKIAAGQSRFTVDMTTLRTDESRRDNFIKRNTLQTDQYPEATFVPTALQGLPSPLPTSGDLSFQISGDLTIHGVTRPATWQVKATVSGQELKGTATAAFKFADFNMSPPRVAMVLSVEDNIRLELDFHLVRQP